MINETIKKNGLTFGVLSGIVSALITSTIYAIDLNLFVSWWIGIVSMVIYLTISIVLLTKTKKEMNGIFVFKDAFTTYFISAVIGTLIGTLFNILLFNVIDPSAKDTLQELTIKSTVNMMKKFNAPASEIKKAVVNLKESNQFSISGALRSSVFSIIFSAFFGLILAAIFKTPNKQEF